MFPLFVVFTCLLSSLVNAASDEFSYNITSGKVTVTCDFKFVYKLGGARIDLRRSTAECLDLPRTIKVKDYNVSSDCGSIFTISLTATKKATTLTAGTVTPSKGCKPTAPPPTMKPKPKRKCPYGTTQICPSFEDGSCLPKQVAMCFKEGKMGKGAAEGDGETPVNMNKNTTEEMMTYKPSKEEREEVIAACMCMPNVALYGGALSLIPPEKKPSKGKGKGKGTTMAPGARGITGDISWDKEPTRSTRTMCNEKFPKNFKIGKNTIKCTWTLIYTDTTLDLAKSKATCTKTAKPTLKGEAVIKTDCGSVITMQVTVGKKTAIKSGEVTSVGTSCKCYKEPTTAAQTTTAATTTAGGTTTGKGTTSGKGTTPGGGKGTTPGGGMGGGGPGVGGGMGGGSPLKGIFSPRFMNECACIEQGAIKKGQLLN